MPIEQSTVREKSTDISHEIDAAHLLQEARVELSDENLRNHTKSLFEGATMGSRAVKMESKQEILQPCQHPIHQPLEDPEFEHLMVQKMVDASSIDGFEREEKVVALYQQLQEKMRAQKPARDIMKACMRLDLEKFQIEQKQNQFDAGVKEIRHASNMIRSGISMFGNKKFAHQFAVASASAMQIGTALAGVMRIGKLASASPLALGDLLMSGLDGIMGLCQPEKAGPNMLSILLPMIEALSEQIQTVREEMHERFDQVLDELTAIHRYLLVNFASLAREGKLTQDLVLALMQSVEKQREQQSMGFSLVTRRIDALASKLHHHEQNTVWAFFERELKPIAKTEDPSLYKHHLQRLFTGFEHSGAYAEAITGRPVQVIRSQELSESSASFYVNTFASMIDQHTKTSLLYGAMQRMQAICMALQREVYEDIVLLEPIDEARVILEEKPESPLVSLRHIFQLH